MVTLLLTPNIESDNVETQEFLAFLDKHLDTQRVRQLKEFGSAFANIANPLTKSDSESGFKRVLDQQNRLLRNFYLSWQKEFANILTPHGITRDVFVRGFIERSSKLFWEIFDTNIDWLNERHKQLLTIAIEDKESYELWMLEHFVNGLRLPNELEANMQGVEDNFLYAQLDYMAIAIIFAEGKPRPALQLLVEDLYKNVAAINFALFEQASPSTRPPSEQKDLDEMGYGKGRLKGETDEDIDAFLEDIRRLRGK